MMYFWEQWEDMENSGKRKINVFFCVNIVNSTLTFINVADAISPKKP